MGARSWLLGDAVRRILADAPLAPATWTSVARRSLVVVACFLAGVALGNVHAGVLAAFGALQVGLVEVALPLRSLVRLQLLLLACCTASVFVGMMLGGTWWAVPAIAGLAFAFGATSGASGAAMTVGISSLALAVIFAGSPAIDARQALQSSGYVAVGIVVQSLAWIVVWRAERRRFVGHAIANKLRTDVRILHGPAIDIAGLVKTHTQVDVAQVAISTAGFDLVTENRYRRALSATIDVTRDIVAWMVLDSTSERDRVDAGLQLEEQIRRLEGRRPRSGAGLGQTLPPSVRTGLDEVDAAVADVVQGTDTSAHPILASAQRPKAVERRSHPVLSALVSRPGVRHGYRMALGVGLAEALSIMLPVAHSFWLPLTVVFTLRSDWSFTVIRGFTRTLGNLAAVIVLPAVLLALGNHVLAVAVALAVLTAVMFRTFFGNYAVASFGLAGSVLLLDSAMSSDAELFVARIVAAVLGALLSMAVALALPSWSSSDGPHQVRTLADGLSRWRSAVDDRLSGARVVPDEEFDELLAASRRDLLHLDQTSTGVLLEPRQGSEAIDLAMVMAAGTHEVEGLIAVSTVLLAPGGDGADAFVRSRLNQTSAAFADAVATYERRT